VVSGRAAAREAEAEFHQKKKEAEAEASYRFFFTGFCVPLDPHAGYEDLRPVSRIFFPRVVWQKQT
jgi:hypothetical protein